MKILKERRPDVYKLLTDLGCEFKSVLEIDVDHIFVDQGIYPRESTDFERVNLYAEDMENGDEFPPIIVADTGEISFNFTLLDGNHRLYATKKLGEKSIKAEVWEVPKALYPVVAQAVNTEEKEIDTPLTVKEKKKAILRDWEILTQYSKEERKKIIAQVLKTSVKYVNNVLSQAGIIKSEKEEIKQKALKLYKEGYKPAEIIKKLGISKRTFYYWINESEQECNFSPSEKLHSTNQPEEETDEDLISYWNEEPEKEEEEEDYDWSDWNERDEEVLAEIKDIVAKMRKLGYTEMQIIKYLRDGEDIDGYTFDDIAKGLNTTEERVIELYREAERQGIKTPRPYQKGKTGRPQKDRSLKLPEEILEGLKEDIWATLVEIEFRFDYETALEALAEIYQQWHDRSYQDNEIYKDWRAEFEYRRIKGK